MKAKEIRKLNDTDMEKKLLELKAKQRDLRVRSARGELKVPQEKQKIKREIARILTILGEKKINGRKKAH